MSRLRIVNDTGKEAPHAGAGDFYPSNACTGYGTVLEMDGKVVRSVRSIEIGPINFDEVLTAKIEVLADDRFEFEADATVTVSIVPFPGCRLVEHVEPDGRRSFVSVPEPVEVS